MTGAKPVRHPEAGSVGGLQAREGQPGSGWSVDRQSVEDFEVRLAANLYKLWNRLSSGSYMPSPVRRVDIPKASGGTRPLGIPTVADRVAQEVVRRYLEPLLEPVFHANSYGYRSGRSAIDAIRTARQRCWRSDWVLDIDIKGFFDSIDHGAAAQGRAQAHQLRLGAPLRRTLAEGARDARRRAILSPGSGERRKAGSSSRCWQTCSCTTRSMSGSGGRCRACRSSVTRTTSSATAGANARRASCGAPSIERFAACGLVLHPREDQAGLLQGHQSGRRARRCSASTSSATRSGRGWRSGGAGSTGSRSCRRQARRL